VRVQDVMSERLQTVPPGIGAEDASQVMRIEGVHHPAALVSTQPVHLFADGDAGVGRQSIASVLLPLAPPVR
jgi:hypothetical protein